MGINETPLYRIIGGIGLAIIISGLTFLMTFISTNPLSKIGILASFIFTIIGFLITTCAIYIDWDKK